MEESMVRYRFMGTEFGVEFLYVEDTLFEVLVTEELTRFVLFIDGGSWKAAVLSLQ